MPDVPRKNRGDGEPMGGEITLREYIDDKFRHLEQLQVQRDQALALQAKEYDRRLLDLNHTHAIAEEKAHEYVTNSRFDEYVKQANVSHDLAIDRMNERISGMEKTISTKIDSLNISRAGGEGRTGGRFDLWSIVIAVVGIACVVYSTIKGH